MVQDRLVATILPSSIAMIAVCVTEVGLVKVAEGRIGPSNVDIYCSITSVVFLISAFCAYISMRIDGPGQLSALFARLADICFISGLVALTVITLLFAFEII